MKEVTYLGMMVDNGKINWETAWSMLQDTADKVGKETIEDVYEGYNRVWGTTFCWEDVRSLLPEATRNMFDMLPENVKYKVMTEHASSIGKGLEYGLMTEWSYVMEVAISNTDLEEDIKEEYSKIQRSV